MNINFCTFTGVGDETPLEKIEALSSIYPFIEWGILLNIETQGQGRYMSLDKIIEINNFSSTRPELNFSLHLCGAAVYDFISGEIKLHDYITNFKRIQLNIVRKKIDLTDLKNIMNYHEDKQFITQHNFSNQELASSLIEVENHNILFDSSGGSGILPVAWPIPIQGKNCGYAGGLGPNNISEQLILIEKAVGVNQDHKILWVDMENNIRTPADTLSFEKCEKVAQVCSAYVNPKVEADICLKIRPSIAN